MKTRVLQALVLTLALVILAACAAPAAAPQPAPVQPTAAPTAVASAPTGSETVWSSRPLVIGSCCDQPKTIDPAVAIDIPGTRITTMAYEALIQYKPGTPELVPQLATEWKVSDDNLTYTFTLREGVKFHDGSDFNADAVKVSFDRVKAMKLGVAFFLESMKEVKVINPKTVEITLTKPDISFYYGLPRIKIISPTAMKANATGSDEWAQDFFREKVAGTGPYTLEQWETGRQLTMTAFEDYWGGWQGKHVRQIIDRFSLDQPTKLLLLEQGEIDLIDQIGLSDVKRLKDNKLIRVGATDVLRGYYHTINNQRGPLKDPKVREAMLLAFPYNEMLNDLMSGFATPLTSMVTANMDGYCDVYQPKQDLDRAKQLLTEAGYPSGGFELTLSYLPGIEPERLSAQLFKDSLAKLNVDLNLREIEWGSLLESQKNLDTAPDFAALYVTSPVPYAGAQLYRLGYSKLQGLSYNWQYYNNPEFDKLVDQAQQTSDSAARNELLCKAQQLMMKDSAILPIMNQQQLDASRTRVVGYKFDAYGYVFDLHAHDLYIEGE